MAKRTRSAIALVSAALRDRARASDPERKAANIERGRRPESIRRAYERKVAKDFGITVEDVARAFNTQRGTCAGCICKLDLGFDTHIDHDHLTGVFRGLLCSNCNNALGRVKDNPMTLNRLAKYLQRAERVRWLA